jgi:putative addiction module component (TIGR02574 family)
MSATEILEQIEKLPPAERQEVAELVMEKYGSFHDALTPEQAAELDRRLAEFEKNPRDGVSWEQVEADLNKRFGWQ